MYSQDNKVSNITQVRFLPILRMWKQCIVQTINMNIKLFIMLTFALRDILSGCSKPSNPSCLPDCSCQNDKYRIEIDCRSAHYKRMPSPFVYAENKENHFTHIILILAENTIEHLDVAFLNQWKTFIEIFRRWNFNGKHEKSGSEFKQSAIFAHLSSSWFSLAKNSQPVS